MAIAKTRRRSIAVTQENGAGGARDQILDAARRLFAHKGYRATSVQDLADEVGSGKASLYHYVRRKDDLLFAIHDQFMKRLSDDLNAIIAKDAGPAEKLRQVIISFVEAVARYPDDATIVNEEMRELSVRNLKRVVAQRDEYERLITRLVEDGIAAGEFRVDDLHVAVRAILGMANWCYRWLRPDGPLTPRQVGEQMAALALAGLRAPRSR